MSLRVVRGSWDQASVSNIGSRYLLEDFGAVASSWYRSRQGFLPKEEDEAVAVAVDTDDSPTSDV